MAELISIIVTTYNREDALDAVLRSLARQDDGHFEIIIADDGSGEATAKLIDTWKTKFGRLDHVWHPDFGFRAAEIRNRAILAARGVYCVFLDGDCIVRPDFVAIHRRLAEPGWFVTGNRVLLSADLTTKVLREKLMPGAWSSDVGSPSVGAAVSIACRRCCICRWPFRRVRQRAWQGARSCNLAIWREDLDRVDGFDADYSGWGKEDPISSFACYTLASAARMGRSRPVCSIFGIETPIVRSYPRMSGSLPGLPRVIASAHGRVYRRFRASLQLPRP